MRLGRHTAETCSPRPPVAFWLLPRPIGLGRQTFPEPPRSLIAFVRQSVEETAASSLRPLERRSGNAQY